MLRVNIVVCVVSY